MKDDQIEQAEMDRLERLARDRGFLITFGEGTTLYKPYRSTRVGVIFLCHEPEEGLVNVTTLPLGEVEAYLLESSAP